MISQDFLLILVSLIGLVLFSIWAGRKPRKPVELNMKAPDTEPVVLPPENKVSLAKESRYAKFASGELPPSAKQVSHARNLNILFNYNGHTWDAYEVLGVPAGASLAEITRCYQKALSNSDTYSHEFLETAYRSILDRRTL